MCENKHEITKDQLFKLYEEIDKRSLLEKPGCVESSVLCPLCGDRVIVICYGKASWAFICRQYGELVTTRGV